MTYVRSGGEVSLSGEVSDNMWSKVVCCTRQQHGEWPRIARGSFAERRSGETIDCRESESGATDSDAGGNTEKKDDEEMRGRRTGIRSAYFWRIRSASALRFSKGCSSLNLERMVTVVCRASVSRCGIWYREAKNGCWRSLRREVWRLSRQVDTAAGVVGRKRMGGEE